MFEHDDFALWYALNRLMANYWNDVDENGGREAHGFYVPDGVYAVGNRRFEGQGKIESFYTRRRYSKIMTRHVLSNLRLIVDDEPYARIAGLMSLYRAEGGSPFQGARPPTMIADFEARCVLDRDRAWRFESHTLWPFIVGHDMPASIMIRPQTL